jgi:radical SAM protein with 4Fe4S-binding SPASM domain
VVQTSIYSLRPTIHDKITRVHGSLSKTIKAVESLLKAGIKVQVSCPIMNINKDEVPDLINFCKKRNIRLKTNALLIPQDNGNREFVDTSRLTLEQKECMLCGMMECDLHYTKNNLLQISNHSESFYQNPKDFLKSTVCGIVEESLCVSSNGDVYPCEGWKKYKLGNIFEESLNDIWRYSDDIRMLRQINKQRNFNKCLECKAIDYCKRCFVDVNDENEGELLRINPRVCKEAFLVKSIIERYNMK